MKWPWDLWAEQRQAERDAYLEALRSVTSIATTLAETLRAQVDLQQQSMKSFQNVENPVARIMTEEDEARLEQEHFERIARGEKWEPVENPFINLVGRNIFDED